MGKHLILNEPAESAMKAEKLVVEMHAGSKGSVSRPGAACKVPNSLGQRR